MKDIIVGKVYCYERANIYLVPVRKQTYWRFGQQQTVIRYIRLDDPELVWNSTYDFALNNWDEA